MIGDRRVVGLRTEWIWCKDIKYLDASSNLIDIEGWGGEGGEGWEGGEGAYLQVMRIVKTIM